MKKFVSEKRKNRKKNKIVSRKLLFAKSGVYYMFKDTKKKSKLQEQFDKEAAKELEKAERARKEAKMIKNTEYVKNQLEIIKEEQRIKEAKMRKVLEKEKESLKDENKDTFECAGCHRRISVSTLACPHCGQLHCQHCGAPLPMGDNFDGKCPRCEGYQNFETAELVVTKVEDIPPEERFWEELPPCPKCGAAVQSDWDECPFCNTKLGKGKKSRAVNMEAQGAEGASLESAADKVEGKLESAKEAQKKLRKEKKKEAEGV